MNSVGACVSEDLGGRGKKVLAIVTEVLIIIV